MQRQTEAQKIKVCVIGAGAAGLCAARHLAADLDKFEFTVFEQTSDVGGTWVYTDKVGVDDYGFPIHSSMYKNLRTNLPREIINFPDFRAIKGDGRSCVTHEVILDYLKNYAEHFKLRQFIQFNTIVECVKPEIIKGESTKWKVRVKNIKSSKTSEITFNAIMICNGHYFDPYIPQIPGLRNFNGQVMHSHNYRKPEEFTGKTIILLGGLSSGTDIAFELSETASRVYLSHNNDRLSSDSSWKITEVQGIQKFEDGKFVLKDGSMVAADVLIFCTGYKFTYSFLDDDCGITVDDNYVAPLYKHMINVEHPSMCFIGIPMIVVPFPMFHIQVQYFLSILNGRSQLPPKLKMLDDARLKTEKKRHAHKLASLQWSYNDELARDGDFTPLPVFYKNGYEAWSAQRKSNLKILKSYNLVVAEDEKTIQIVPYKKA